jgi:hypothetical protein
MKIKRDRMQEKWEKKKHASWKMRRATSILIAFPSRPSPGSPSLGIGRRASPSVIIQDRRRLVSQFGWWVRILRVMSRHLVLTHMLVIRRAGRDGEGINRDRL